MTELTVSTSNAKATPEVAGKVAAPDIKGILERFTLPGFDVNAFLESRKLDIDAVTHATAIAFAGAQKIVDNQAELLKTVLAEIGEELGTVPQDTTGAGELLRKQQKIANDALSSTLTSMKEIADTLGKSQSEIFEIATARARSNFEEIRRLANGTEPEKTAK